MNLLALKINALHPQRDSNQLESSEVSALSRYRLSGKCETVSADPSEPELGLPALEVCPIKKPCEPNLEVQGTGSLRNAKSRVSGAGISPALARTEHHNRHRDNDERKQNKRAMALLTCVEWGDEIFQLLGLLAK